MVPTGTHQIYHFYFCSSRKIHIFQSALLIYYYVLVKLQFEFDSLVLNDTVTMLVVCLYIYICYCCCSVILCKVLMGIFIQQDPMYIHNLMAHMDHPNRYTKCIHTPTVVHCGTKILPNTSPISITQIYILHFTTMSKKYILVLHIVEFSIYMKY